MKHARNYRMIRSQWTYTFSESAGAVLGRAPPEVVTEGVHFRSAGPARSFATRARVTAVIRLN